MAGETRDAAYATAVAVGLKMHIDAGATIHPGQFGDTVVQYEDRYLVGNGLVWAENRGKWRPLPVSDLMPTEPAQEGACVWGSNGLPRWVFLNGAWMRDPYA